MHDGPLKEFLKAPCAFYSDGGCHIPDHATDRTTCSSATLATAKLTRAAPSTANLTSATLATAGSTPSTARLTSATLATT